MSQMCIHCISCCSNQCDADCYCNPSNHPSCSLHLIWLFSVWTSSGSEPLLGNRASDPISEGEVRRPGEEIHFSNCLLGSCSFWQNLQLVIIGERRLLVNQEVQVLVQLLLHHDWHRNREHCRCCTHSIVHQRLHSSLTREQVPKISDGQMKLQDCWHCWFKERGWRNGKSVCF